MLTCLCRLMLVVSKFYIVVVVPEGSVSASVVRFVTCVCVCVCQLASMTRISTFCSRPLSVCIDLKHCCLCCSQNPVQEWGEEVEDGAVYGVTLRREPVPSSPHPDEKSPGSAFVQYRTFKVRRLKAATLDLLVNHLLASGGTEQDYSRIFLSTYRTFTSTGKLIELLYHR